MCDGDFDPPGWIPEREEFKGEGNAGCAVFFICAFFFAIIIKCCGC